jgi:hypothetical protein
MRHWWEGELGEIHHGGKVGLRVIAVFRAGARPQMAAQRTRKWHDQQPVI